MCLAFSSLKEVNFPLDKKSPSRLMDFNNAHMNALGA